MSSRHEAFAASITCCSSGRPSSGATSFCEPKRRAAPAARITPPICGGSASARRRKRLRGEASTAAVAADRDDVGEDRERDLLGGSGADVETNGCVHARKVVLSEALVSQPRETFRIGGPAPDRADASRLDSECRTK